MTHDEMTKHLYWVAGMLEGFTYLTNLPEGVAMSLSECVDRLEIIGAHLAAKDVQKNEETTEAFGRVYPAPLQAGTDL